jgi:hypothetical protein
MMGALCNYPKSKLHVSDCVVLRAGGATQLFFSGLLFFTEIGPLI